MTSQDRVLVRDGRRHHRPTYSRTEFRVGLGILGMLAVVLSWVAWRGQHPDPALFSAGENLLQVAADIGAPGGGATTPVDRGVLPEGLAAAGWTEGDVSTFGYDDLYEKIDGREGYYKSLGFQQLWFVSIARAEDPTVTVDVEVYDLGETGNALGAYAGERPPGSRPEVGPDGLAHLDRNALVLARGRHYIRAIGSDETPVVQKQLEHLRGVLESGIEGEALPWAFGMFVGRMGLAPEQVSYMAENAFSFGFATDVYAARLEDDTELFVVTTDSPEQASELASRFNEGFLAYGSPIETSVGVDWAEDRYIRTVAGAKGVRRWTVGVRGAPDLATAQSGLARIEQAILEAAEE